MLGQATSRSQVLQGLQQHGAAPGGRKMIDWEEEAAQLAMQSGIYGVYRSSSGRDCTRVGPSSKCFCGHLYNEHTSLSKKAPFPRCTTCACEAFRFVPTRPEEVGDWWLVRRKGFNVHTWRAKCRCGHSHEEHDPKHMRCRCGCAHFQSNFACLACDKLWEDHETVFETAQERVAQGRPIGEDFMPLAGDSEIREIVFPAGRLKQAQQKTYQPSKVRPAQVPARQAEKSVQIMHETSGGRIKGQDVANRWGRVPAPPTEWLYMGGGPGTSNGLPASRNNAAPSRLEDGRGAGAQSSRASSYNTDVSTGVGAGSRPGSTSHAAGMRSNVGLSAVGRPAGMRTVHNTVSNGEYSLTAEGDVGPQPRAMSSGFRPVYD